MNGQQAKAAHEKIEAAVGSLGVAKDLLGMAPPQIGGAAQAITTAQKLLLEINALVVVPPDGIGAGMDADASAERTLPGVGIGASLGSGSQAGGGTPSGTK
jgi:hypothetical protein